MIIETSWKSHSPPPAPFPNLKNDSNIFYVKGHLPFQLNESSSMNEIIFSSTCLEVKVELVSKSYQSRQSKTLYNE